MIIDAPVLTEPRTWVVTKVNRISSKGLCLTTAAQTLFDEHRDYIEQDEFGNVIGMWADYYKSPILPAPEPHDKPDYYSEILWSGLKPQLKIGGSYKTFTVNFYDHKNELIDLPLGYWKVEIDGVEMNEDDFTMLNNTSSGSLADNQIKLKLSNNRDLLDKTLKLSYIADGRSTELLIEIIAL